MTPQTTSIPKVPIKTAMFDANNNLTRPWIYFFERIAKGNTNAAAASGLEFRTLLLKNTVPGTDIADHVTVHAGGSIALIAGVLRKAITSTLTVNLNIVTATATKLVGSFSIPPSTAINTPVQFAASKLKVSSFDDLDVLSWDVTASDSSSDLGGIASFSVWWTPSS